MDLARFVAPFLSFVFWCAHIARSEILFMWRHKLFFCLDVLFPIQSVDARRHAVGVVFPSKSYIKTGIKSLQLELS
jgi:hypothetical protein